MKTVLLTFLFSIFCIISVVTSSPVRSYIPSLDERDRQEIITLAAKIIKVAMEGYGLPYSKRNAGTINTLYNLPDLIELGRRR